MSVDPNAIPDAAPAAPAETGSDLAQIWSNLWPWDELNAKGPPERWLRLGTEILPVLAALVAQDQGKKPHLLRTDPAGRLVVTSIQAFDVQASQTTNLATASIALAAKPGYRIMLVYLLSVYTYQNADAVIHSKAVRIWDGASGGTQIGGWELGTSAQSPQASNPSTPAGLIGSYNKAMTIDFDMNDAGLSTEALTAGGLYIL